MALGRYASNMRRAVDYIEKNIKQNVSYADAAAAAGMSVDNFWRVFKKLFGETIGSYIRARRLTLIARKLTGTSRKVSDVAPEYGYESQEIFTRAFSSQFGMTPTQYRRKKRNLYFLERHRLTGKAIRHILGGGISLKPKIVAVKGFELCGVLSHIRMKNAVADGSKACVKFLKNWKYVLKSGGGDLYAYCAAIRDRSIAEFWAGSDAELLFGYPAGICPKGMARRKVRAGKYAVFVHRGGLDSIWISYQYIFGNWIRRQPQGDMAGYLFERADNKFVMGTPLWVEIYVPIVKKRG